MIIKSLKNLLPLVSILIVMTVFLVLTAQNDAHASQWVKTYAIASSSEPDTVQQTRDGGYVIGGNTDFRTGNRPWIAKLDIHGNILWERKYDEYHYLSSVRQTNDSGYIIATRGYNHRKILKLDASGAVEWQQAYLGGAESYMMDVLPSNDGGYIAALQFDKFGYEQYKIALLKLDVSGNILWQKAYGNNGDAIGVMAVRPTKDGGYISGSWACGMPPQTTASCRTIILKIDADGDIEWQKQYKTEDLNLLHSLEQTSDGGYIVAGSIRKFGRYDAWVLKLDQNGNAQWQKSYGGGASEEAYTVQQGKDGRYIVGGFSQTFGKNLRASAWIFQLDPTGAIMSEYTHGDGTFGSDIYSMGKTSDNGFVALGDIQGSTLLLMKTDDEGRVPGCSLRKRSHAVVTDTTAVASDPQLIQSNAHLTAEPAPITPVDTSTTVTDVCYGVTLMTPDGGETIDAGAMYPIGWLPHPDAASYSLKYSRNNGRTWMPIAQNYASPDTYNWWVPVPGNNKSGCLVKIAGYNAEGKLVGTDISKAPFAINVVSMTTPDSANQIWTSGSPMTIAWSTSATARPVATTELYYTKDASVTPETWLPIASLQGNPGSYSWTVPSVQKIKANCKLKVVLKDKTGNIVGSDESDVPFTIEP